MHSLKSEAQRTTVTYPASLPEPPSYFVGRERTLAQLDARWDEGHRGGKSSTAKVVSIIAFAGTGKTTLLLEWLRRLKGDSRRRPRRIFYYSFDGLSVSGQFSVDEFLDQALSFFDPASGDPTDGDPSALELSEDARRAVLVEDLARRVAEERNLLILDGLEALQKPLKSEEPGGLDDSVIGVLLTKLGRDDRNRSLCLVTSRFPVADLNKIPRPRTATIDLEDLEPEDGAELLKQFGVIEPKEGLDEELRRAAVDCGGHALTICLLGHFLAQNGKDARDRGQVRLLDQMGEPANGALRVMERYETWLGADSLEVGLLCLLGFFDQPAESRLLNVLLSGSPQPRYPALSGGISFDSGPCHEAVERLKSAGLVLVRRAVDQGDVWLDTHPLIREYFGLRAEQDAELWKEGNSRLFDAQVQHHTTRYPTSLYEMKPWYAAVVYACRAGRFTAAYATYDGRIRQGEMELSTRRMGAFGSEVGVLAGFFQREPTTGVVDWGSLDVRAMEDLKPSEQCVIYRAAGIALRAQGRIGQALLAWKQAYDIVRRNEKRRHLADAAYLACQMSAIWVTLGKLPEAKRWAKKAVEAARRSHSRKRRNEALCVLGDVQRLLNELDKARKSFQRAEALIKKQDGKSKCDKLYGVEGFWYCDLLLQRAVELAESVDGTGDADNRLTLALEALEEVRDRAEEIRARAHDEQMAVPKSLHSLALGRALMLHEFYSGGDDYRRAESLLKQAVAGLRNIRNQLPQALVALAAVERVQGRYSDALADLAEARAVAEAGSMKRFLPEIHLELVRVQLARRSDSRLDEARRRKCLESAQRNLDEARAAIAELERFCLLDGAVNRLNIELSLKQAQWGD